MIRLFVLLLSLAAAAAVRADEKETAKTEEKRLDAKSLHVMAFSVLDGSALVVLSDASGKKLVPLRFDADENGYRLLSASVQAETKELKVVAFLEGKEHTFTQALSAMPKVPLAAKKRGFGGSIPESSGDDKKSKEAGSSGKSPPRAGRGPTEEDRKKYEALSEAQKDKFRDAMRELFSKEDFRNASEDERRDTIRKIFDRIQQQGTEPKTPN